MLYLTPRQKEYIIQMYNNKFQPYAQIHLPSEHNYIEVLVTIGVMKNTLITYTSPAVIAELDEHLGIKPETEIKMYNISNGDMLEDLGSTMISTIDQDKGRHRKPINPSCPFLIPINVLGMHTLLAAG